MDPRADPVVFGPVLEPGPAGAAWAFQVRLHGSTDDLAPGEWIAADSHAFHWSTSVQSIETSRPDSVRIQSLDDLVRA